MAEHLKDASSYEAAAPLPLLSLSAAILAISVAGAGFGHSLPLFSVLLKTYGASDYTIGFNTAVAAIAALLATPFFPPVVRRMGLKRFLILSLTVMVLPYLFVPWAGERIWLWYPLRFIFSLGGAGLFAGSEIWINGIAPDRIRGRVIGVYGTCLALGFALGPLLIELTGYEGWLPFLVGAAVFSSAALPLLVARSPDVSPESTGSIFEPIRKDPVLFGSAGIFACVESAMLIFLPILAMEIGHGVGVGAKALTVYGIGIVAAQLPVGQLCDRFPPRLVMAGCSAVGAIFALAVPVVQESVWLFYAVLFFWGGAIGGIYTAGLTVLGNRFKGAALAAANTAFVFSYALGAVAGPLGAGLVRGSLGPEALIVMIALVLGLYAWAARRRGAAA